MKRQEIICDICKIKINESYGAIKFLFRKHVHYDRHGDDGLTRFEAQDICKKCTKDLEHEISSSIEKIKANRCFDR